MATKKKKTTKNTKSGEYVFGRPPKYGKHILKLTKEYLDQCGSKYKTETIPYTNTEGKTILDTRTYLDLELPSIEGLSVYLDVTRETVYDWEDKYPDFSDSVNKLRAKQGLILINGGVSGRLNSPITKVMLSKHGYKEATEVDEKVTHKIDISKMLDKAYPLDEE